MGSAVGAVVRRTGANVGEAEGAVLLGRRRCSVGSGVGSCSEYVGCSDGNGLGTVVGAFDGRGVGIEAW